MEKKPLKRHCALHSLSKEHHYSLLLCWEIRKWLEAGIGCAVIGNYLTKMWNQQLDAHFLVEEKYVFTILGENHPDVRKAKAEHRALKRLFLSQEFTLKVVVAIEETLEKHVRFEERVLFPAVQRMATEKQLKKLLAVHEAPGDALPWEDIFAPGAIFK